MHLRNFVWKILVFVEVKAIPDLVCDKAEYTIFHGSIFWKMRTIFHRVTAQQSRSQKAAPAKEFPYISALKKWCIFFHGHYSSFFIHCICKYFNCQTCIKKQGKHKTWILPKLFCSLILLLFINLDSVFW